MSMEAEPTIATPEQHKPMSRDFRTGIILATLGLEYTGYFLLTILGSPENALHVSAQTGLFWSANGILVVLGITSQTVIDVVRGK